MNADFTNANVNGQSAQVLVLASPVNGAALYIGREKKGHEGVKGTPLEDYTGTVVHDHDRTFTVTDQASGMHTARLQDI